MKNKKITMKIQMKNLKVVIKLGIKDLRNLKVKITTEIYIILKEIKGQDKNIRVNKEFKSSSSFRLKKTLMKMLKRTYLKQRSKTNTKVNIILMNS
jgi:hypothetical protein